MRLCKCGKPVKKYHQHGIFKSYLRTCGDVECRKISEETRKRMSIASTGRIGSMRGKKHSQETKNKIREGNTGKVYSSETRLKISLAKRGDKSHFWRGGICQENELERKSARYKEWRKSVFERDDYTCQECLIRGFSLHADHIKPFSIFKELRFAIDNGRTLCVPCHKKTPTYGVNAKYAKTS